MSWPSRPSRGNGLLVDVLRYHTADKNQSTWGQGRDGTRDRGGTGTEDSVVRVEDTAKHLGIEATAKQPLNNLFNGARPLVLPFTRCPV